MRRLEIVLGPLVAKRIRIVVADRVPLTEQGKADRTAIEMILQGDQRSSYAPLQSVGNLAADRRLGGRQNAAVNEPEPAACRTQTFCFPHLANT
jgi:fatty-acyl-CoA synthase